MYPGIVRFNKLLLFKFILNKSDKMSIFSSLLKKEARRLELGTTTITKRSLKLMYSHPLLFSDYQILISHLLFIPIWHQSLHAFTKSMMVSFTCVSIVSNKLNDAECNYSTVELEALAVIFTITKFMKYLLGTKFTIESDNQPLFITTRLIPGTKNFLADLMSRL